MSPPDHEVSPFDRLRHDDAQLAQLLASGRLERELQGAFGPAQYRELARLARVALRARVRRAEAIVLVPGILGSQLGAARQPPLPPDLLWLDPHDVIAGGLMRLRLPGEPLAPLGALPLGYLALRLRLQAAGYAVHVHDYDWRLDLHQQAPALAARVRALGQPVALVAHSMGGLLARLALARLAGEVPARVALLGVPHRGSFGAVQSLRGSYPVVRRLAALDHMHDAETLATQVFATFPSLYQLVPDARLAGHDLHLPGTWPTGGPRPDGQLLPAARGFLDSLPPVQVPCLQVAGSGQRTVTGIESHPHEFEYAIDSRGDGTVPVDSAILPDLPAVMIECEHSRLPRDARVARLLLRWLDGAPVEALPGSARGTLAATGRFPALQRHVHVGDEELARNWNRKLEWASLAPEARRTYLENLNLAPPQYASRGPREPIP